MHVIAYQAMLIVFPAGHHLYSCPRSVSDDVFPMKKATSEVRKVEKQRLHALQFDKAQEQNSDIAGCLAANKFRNTH